LALKSLPHCLTDDSLCILGATLRFAIFHRPANPLNDKTKAELIAELAALRASGSGPAFCPRPMGVWAWREQTIEVRVPRW